MPQCDTTRRTFLQSTLAALGSLPMLGWVKPNPAAEVSGCHSWDNAAGGPILTEALANHSDVCFCIASDAVLRISRIGNLLVAQTEADSVSVMWDAEEYAPGAWRFRYDGVGERGELHVRLCHNMLDVYALYFVREYA